MYKYDLHTHTNAGSLCGVSSPEEMVAAYAKAGYSGIVITDHFICGNTCVPRSLEWTKRIDAYFSAYERAAKAAKEFKDFTVFFGAEYAYAAGHEILIYGAEKKFLYEHPEIENADIFALCELLKKNGCLVISAHPFREREYNDFSVPAELPCADGAEIYNSHNSDSENQRALNYVAENSLIPSSGGDIHDAADRNIGLAGIETEKKIKSSDELISVLRAGNYRVLAKGKSFSLNEVF